MPALVKASPSVLSGNYALINFSISQTADLAVSVDAEFVGLPSAADNIFKVGSTPPPSLLNYPRFTAALRTYGSRIIPKLTDYQVATSNGLKYIQARYSSSIEPTNTVATEIAISVNESGEIVLQEVPTDESGGSSSVIGSVGGEGATGIAGEVLSGLLQAGSSLKEITVSSSWQSFSGSAPGPGGGSIAFSFDYLSLSTTVSYSGEFAGPTSGYAGAVGPAINARGIIPINVQSGTRDTQRFYSNSRGEYRAEYSSVGYYFLL